MAARNPQQEVPVLIINTSYYSLANPSSKKEFTIKNDTIGTLSTYSHSNGISDYLKNKIPGLGESIDADHDRPSDLKIIDSQGTVSYYSVLRAELTDLQDQVNEHLTELMAQEKDSRAK